MPTLGEHKLYDFRKQAWQDVQSGLSNLINAKAKLVEAGGEPVSKMFAYIEPLRALANKDATDVLSLVENEIMLFLDAELMQQFLDNPKDDEARNGLSIQLAFIASATNNVTGINPYTKDELAAVLKGEDTIYDDIIFLSTLRKIISDGIDNESGAMLLHTLPALSALDDTAKSYFWDDAFIFSLLLQALWKLFPEMNSSDRQFLMQNYFYSAIVAGVPVRYYMQDFLASKSEADFDRLSEAIIQDLQNNNESAPVDSANESGKALSELLKMGMLKVYSEQIDMLELEKFIKNIYPAQTDNNFFYTMWLREALAIILHLKKGDIMDVTLLEQ